MWLGWGRELFFFGNDACRLLHRRVRDGVPARKVWAARWDDIGALADSVRDGGETATSEWLRWPGTRRGEGERHLRFFFSPITDEAGAVAGVLCVVTESTGELSVTSRPERTARARRAASGRLVPVDSSGALAGQRETEAALRDTEHRLQLATRIGKLGIWDWDVVTNRVSWSESLYGIHGVRPEEFEGTVEGFNRLLHPEDRDRVGAAIRAALGGADYEIEFRVLRPDGGIVWLYANGVVVCDEGRPVRMFGAVMDVTERRRAVEAVSQSEERFSRFMQHLPGLAWIKDERGRYVFANGAAGRVFGLPASELLGRTDHDLFAPETAEQFARNDRLALASERGAQTIETLRHQDDGRLHHSLVTKFPIPAGPDRPPYVGGMAIDITERKQAEQASQRLAAIVASSGDAILAVDRDGFVTSWNRGAERLYGYAEVEIVGQAITLLIPRDRRGEESDFLERVGRGERIDHFETQRVRKDGTTVDVSLSISPIRDAAGAIVGASKIARDIGDRKRAEIELRRREQLYRAIGESIDYGVWVCDTTGRNVYASDSFLQLVGLTQEQCSGLDWTQVLHPDDAASTAAAWMECVRTGKRWERQHRFRGVDGRWHPILARGIAVRDDRGEITSWVGINLDISRLKANEEALREQTRRLAILNRVGSTLAAELEIGRVVQVVVDAGRDVCGAAFGAFFCNARNEHGERYELFAHSGASRETFESLGVSLQTPLLGPTLRGEGVVRIGDLQRETSLWTGNGGDGWPAGHAPMRSYLAVPVVSRSGAVHGGLFFGHADPDMFQEDAEQLILAIAAQAAITIDNAQLYSDVQRELREHQRAEAALRESEERFRTLADNIAQFAWTADATGWISWYNQRWFDYTGTTLAEMQGRGWRAVHHPDHVEQVAEKFSRCIAAGTVWEDTFPLRGRDGAYRWFLSRAVPIRGDHGRVVRWFGTNTDITELRDAEQALERARDEAVAASRAKDDFLAALSHELRTPLNPVLLLASDAADDPALPPEVRADFATIRKHVSLEARLIDDLLDLTRISRGKLSLDFGEHDLHAVLRDALATVTSEIEAKAIALTLRFQSEAPRVRADAVRLQQVFWNVLKNAVKFTPAGGRMTLATRVLPQGDRVEVTVEDTGIGMTDDELTRVFDAFSQGNHAACGDGHRFGGLGLGLAISRMVVELHSGTITAASAGPSQGATFTITLPVLAVGEGAAAGAPAVPEFSAREPASPVAAAKERRILLVEDHAPTRAALERLLARRRFVVVSAASIVEARAHLDASRFDLLISDVGLPDGNGCDLMQDCARPRGVRGIALTGYGMEHDVIRSRAAGFSAHLTKPISVHALDRAIQAAVEDDAPPVSTP